jgi:DNA-directed RNA polymerase specialized sigma24 family protein
MSPRTTYRDPEVRHWIEDYEEAVEFKGTKPGGQLRTLLALVDIDKALQALNLKERQAAFLCGQVGLSARTAGNLIGVPASTMHRRYQFALETITTYLNGAHG